MNTPIYHDIAQAFVKEDVDAVFLLSGDGNMHWATAISAQPGMRTIHVRHEQCACSMAMAYAMASGKIGVASVTCGPGFTQIMTALTTASRARIPIVVFAGETALGEDWNLQAIDQAALASVCGAAYVAARSAATVLSKVREAFLIARTERKPVVLGIPVDVQKARLPAYASYIPSSTNLQIRSISPDPELIAKAVDLIAKARRVLVIAGRGTLYSESQSLVESLADRCRGLLATTLPVRGMFDEHDFSLGIVGGFSTPVARSLIADADVVIAVGAGLGYFTTDHNSLFPSATVIQIDERPLAMHEGSIPSDLYIQSSVKSALSALLERLPSQIQGNWRDRDIADRISRERAGDTNYEVTEGLLDPRQVVAELDAIIPKDWNIVGTQGHSSYFHTQMRRRHPKFYHAIREFGAIGDGLSYAIGVALARKSRNIVLFEGDGGLLMHCQEFETLRRHNIRLLVCAFNDGAFGAEIHKLRAEGIDDGVAKFGFPELAQIAQGHGLRGKTFTSMNDIGSHFNEFASQNLTEVWDFRISDQVISPLMQRNIGRISSKAKESSYEQQHFQLAPHEKGKLGSK
jgi:acetolactate synthase-1/2/3 large subunit